MIEPIERVFRSFGATPIPVLHVYGAKHLVKLALHTLPRSLLQRLAQGWLSPQR